MEENTDRIAQLLLSGGENKALDDKINKIASLFQDEQENGTEKAKKLLEGGFEENFINFDENLKKSLSSHDEQQKYQDIGQKLLQGGESAQQEADVDQELQQALLDLKFGGKMATKEELKQIHPDKNPKLMSLYQEYHESSSQKDEKGFPLIYKVNNYDLAKYLQTITSLTMSGGKYQDPDFPPSKQSLLGDGTNKDGLKWLSGPNPITIFRRCSEIFGEGKFNLFKGGIEPGDMNQGAIGNCYFMGSIAALAETPSRIQKLFVNTDGNPAGCYALNLCEFGLWREIMIDDYIPCTKNNGLPAFAHNNGSEIWAMLIEKVWAKIYGGYANIIGGLGREVFNEMTGAPCKTLRTQNPQTFEEIFKGEQLNWPMCCASNQGSGSHDNKTSGGIANCHLYTMLGGYKVKYQGKDFQLVRLRNPWGKCEWKGPFGDGWAGWNDQSLRAQAPYEQKDDGIFYMTFQDFQKEFSHVDICMYFDHYKFTTLSCTTPFADAKFFEITITTTGSYFFLAIQQSERKFKKQDKYQYSRITLTLVADKDNKIYPIRFAKDPASYPNIDQWIYCEKLDAGKYYLGTKCLWYDKKPHQVTLKSYGEDHIEFKSADSHRYSNFKF